MTEIATTVAALLAAGRTRAQIADEIGKTTATVNNCIYRGMQKAGAETPEQWAAQLLPEHNIPTIERPSASTTQVSSPTPETSGRPIRVNDHTLTRRASEMAATNTPSALAGPDGAEGAGG